MALIHLDVEEKELQTVLTILNNLKTGLITNIEVEKKKGYTKSKKIKQEPLVPVNISSKYIDPQTFKERLKKMRNKNGQ